MFCGGCGLLLLLFSIEHDFETMVAVWWQLQDEIAGVFSKRGQAFMELWRGLSRMIYCHSLLDNVYIYMTVSSHVEFMNIAHDFPSPTTTVNSPPSEHHALMVHMMNSGAINGYL